jgi:hypothetical protein
MTSKHNTHKPKNFVRGQQIGLPVQNTGSKNETRHPKKFVYLRFDIQHICAEKGLET